jgi:hypothetical protein
MLIRAGREWCGSALDAVGRRLLGLGPVDNGGDAVVHDPNQFGRRRVRSEQRRCHDIRAGVERQTGDLAVGEQVGGGADPRGRVRLAKRGGG